MSRDSTASTLSLLQLVARCRRETERYLQQISSDSAFCFELFYRAVVLDDSPAWDAIYRQYQSITARWVLNCSSFLMTGETVDFFVNRAFEKFWTAVKSKNFDRFPDLASLLRYLKMCVFSVVIDFARRKERSAVIERDNSSKLDAVTADEDVEQAVFDQTYYETLWELVQTRLQNEQEYVVIYGSYLLGLKPRELVQAYPAVFDEPRDVSRVKENVLARLRRDTSLLSLLR